jgi:hypothetical protein
MMQTTEQQSVDQSKTAKSLPPSKPSTKRKKAKTRDPGKSVRKSFADFERTGRVDKNLAKHLDKGTLKFLTELREFCNRLHAGKVSNHEFCRFIDRLAPNKE